MKNLKKVQVYLLLFALGTIVFNGCKKTEEDSPIIKKDPAITWENPADITFPTALSNIQLNATADVPGTFVYTPASGIVLSIGTTQDLKVDFTPTDATNYNTATKTVTINVKSSSTTVTDYDGNIYNTVVIGSQTWTVENLKVTHYRNGDPIANVTDNAEWATLTTGAYCFYNNSTANKDTYGALYNWYAVSDPRNIAPEGWHVATDTDWAALETYLGGADIAGGKIKEAGTSHWESPNTSATNSSGLTALPCGDRGSTGGMEIGGRFMNLGSYGSYWTSTGVDATIAYNRYLSYGHAGIYRDNGYLKINGYGVRLVKD